MRRRVTIAVLTALVFAAGFAARVWTERHRSMPPPPGPLGSEFAHPRTGYFDVFRHDRPLNRAELIAMVEALEPQLKVFRGKMDAINDEFNKEMDTVLTPEQRIQRAERLRHMREGLAQEETSTEPLSDNGITTMLRDQPAQTIMWDIVIPLRLDSLTRVYKLDEKQREQVRALLKARRDKVLALIDSSPPPSVTLSRLATLIQRLTQPSEQVAK